MLMVCSSLNLHSQTYSSVIWVSPNQLHLEGLLEHGSLLLRIVYHLAFYKKTVTLPWFYLLIWGNTYGFLLYATHWNVLLLLLKFSSAGPVEVLCSWLLCPLTQVCCLLSISLFSGITTFSRLILGVYWPDLFSLLLEYCSFFFFKLYIFSGYNVMFWYTHLSVPVYMEMMAVVKQINMYHHLL